MPRPRAHARLLIFLNSRLVGRLSRLANGVVEFSYDPDWLNWRHSLPISLSLPLRETRYLGGPIENVLENLLPDSKAILRRVADRVGAEGTDPYSMLTAIGRDCVGALQFVPDDDGAEIDEGEKISGDVLSHRDIADMIASLKRAPLGVGADLDEDFRISVAGAQEKTALLRSGARWIRPHGRTPTTHIFKPQIGEIQTSGGMVDMSNSVENEYYCLKLLETFGLATNRVEMRTFGGRRVLVIERFDRRWARDGRLLRVPQEDLCQALSVPPTKKYQNQGGPGVVAIADLLRGSDEPEADLIAFFKSQILFWLIGATDGHAKNFSIFLAPGGRFRLTPFYDVLTAQPGVDARQIRRNAFKLAMSVGASGKYRIAEITGRHFAETGRKARLPRRMIDDTIRDVLERSETAFDRLANTLPRSFPEAIHASVSAAAVSRLRLLAAGLDG